MVAPTKMTVPSSTCGRKASCWLLLKRCTSSTKSTQSSPCSARRRFASATTSRISFTPDSTAESARKRAFAYAATSRPRVVFPVPGGPQKIIEWARPASIATRNGLPGPKRCACPTSSSRVRGLMRSARGRVASAAGSKSAFWPVTATLRPGMTRYSVFAGQVENHPASRGIKPKLQCHKTIRDGPNRVKKTALLRQQQDTQCTRDFQPHRDSVSARIMVVQYEQMIRRLQAQSEDFLLSAAQTFDERQQLAITHRSHRYPGEFLKFRQVDASPSAFGQLGNHGRRHLHRPEQGRQQVKQVRLMQVLQRRRVTDDVGHWPSRVQALPWTS